MKKIIPILFFISSSFILFGQKQDRNWAFGYNCGIDFNDVNNPKLFNPVTNNYEFSACISDNSGKLLIYVGCSTNTDPFKFSLYNGNNKIIEGGDDVNINNTFERGMIIIPKPDFPDQYYVFYTGFSKDTIGVNPRLYMSLVDMSAGPEGKVLIKDSLIMPYQVEEGIACVKHANGKDWWLVKHQLLDKNLSSTADCFITLLINSSGISGLFFQHIGTMHINTIPTYLRDYPDGFACFSQSGNLMAYSAYVDGLVDLFNFDRCSGLLFNHKMVCNDPLYVTYGLEFSPNEKLLYLTRFRENMYPPYHTSDLLQYNILNSNFNTIWNDQPNGQYGTMAGQLKLAPNDKIYLAYSSRSGPYHPYSDTCNKNLCVINYPDLLETGCGFQPFSFYLGDSAIAEINLPNMPNYNLEPYDIYLADAGPDKIICTENNPDHGVYIGSPSISGLTYAWWPSDGISNPYNSNPLANPSKTTKYYLKVIDNSLSYPCNTRIDSVVVEVIDFNCSINVIDCNLVEVFPSPASNTIKIDGITEPTDFSFYNSLGEKIMSSVLEKEKNQIQINLPSGMYLYRMGNCFGKIIIITK